MTAAVAIALLFMKTNLTGENLPGDTLGSGHQSYKIRIFNFASLGHTSRVEPQLAHGVSDQRE